MSWTESTSTSFQCRHSSGCAEDAARVLALLERTRDRLSSVLPPLEREPTIVLHDTPHALVLSNPLMPALWAATCPPARRYVAGWSGSRELHVLAPSALRDRASRVTGSFEMLALAPASLYARRVVSAANRELRDARAAGSIWHNLRWSWLFEGCSRWLSGESGYSQNVVGGYLRAGHRPHFPPSMREAPLLASSLIELVAERHEQRGVVRLASRLHSGGVDAALASAFPGQALGTIENEWRSRLRRLADDC